MDRYAGKGTVPAFMRAEDQEHMLEGLRKAGFTVVKVARFKINRQCGSLTPSHAQWSS
jgi:hypothetical protein